MTPQLTAGGKNWRDRSTISVPEAGELLGLCRNGAYDAAKRGDFPTIRVGRKIRVPTAPLARMLDGTST